MVSDSGNFISGQLIYDEAGQPFGLVGIGIDAIQNSKGVDLPRQFARDAEAMAVIMRDGVPAGGARRLREPDPGRRFQHGRRRSRRARPARSPSPTG